MPDHLIAAYAVLWVLPFILIATIWVRQRRLERQIEHELARMDAAHPAHLDQDNL
ncbi:MAG: hypothetical protein GX601_18965 [Anaerolineales bacterium]|nr:hypothetical protein [Anaerolineales bacterium]